jgi:hypothetical protein
MIRPAARRRFDNLARELAQSNCRNTETLR